MLSELAVTEINAEAVLILIPSVRDGSIESLGLPWNVSGEGKLWKILPFRVSGRAKESSIPVREFLIPTILAMVYLLYTTNRMRDVLEKEILPFCLTMKQ